METSETYEPPIKLTPRILDLCTRIGILAGRYEGLNYPAPRVELRKENTIKTIHGTVAIEGNTLSEEQITAILEGKPVIGPEKDIREVRNAISAYERIKDFDVLSVKDLLNAHKMLMEGLIPDAGRFRKKSVGILRQDGVSHIAPPAELVPAHMNNLFSFLGPGAEEYHPLVKASAFHYELEFIHPFTDGNGRIGRFWEHALLISWHPVFELLSIEAIIKENQQAYYAALEKSDNIGSCEDFLEFDLAIILETLERFFDNFQAAPVTARERLQLAGKKLKLKPFSRKDYMGVFKILSSATASRDLKHGVDSGILTRTGDRRKALYVFK